MFRNLIGAASAVVLLYAGWAFTDDAKPERKPATKKDVETMMKATHDGKESPLRRVAKEVKSDAPNWENLTKDAKAITEMGELLVSFPKYTKDKDYVDAAASLTKAAKAKDPKEALTAYAGLMKSCSSCHYGAPGKR